MIDYIKGEITELGPAEMTLENNGIGYKILIALQTFSQLEGKTSATVYIHHYLREDEELYYGFGTKDERELFRLLIGVSGIGAATARMMLSSLSSEEIRNAIIAEDINKRPKTYTRTQGQSPQRRRRRYTFTDDSVEQRSCGRSHHSTRIAGLHKGKRAESGVIDSERFTGYKHRIPDKDSTEKALIFV